MILWSDDIARAPKDGTPILVEDRSGRRGMASLRDGFFDGLPVEFDSFAWGHKRLGDRHPIIYMQGLARDEIAAWAEITAYDASEAQPS